MQTFGAFLVSFLVAGGMAAAVPAEPTTATTATTATVKAVYNPQHIPHGPSALAKTRKKFGAPVSDSLAAAASSKYLIADANVAKRQQGSAPTKPFPLGGGYDREYLTTVSIGTPAQNLPLDFDTGSSDLWVFSSETPKSQSRGHTIYDPSKSSTSTKQAQKTWAIHYGDGSSSNGDVWTDKVTIGGLIVARQAVETAEQVSDEFVQDTETSGLLGLAFDFINTVRPLKALTWFTNIKKSLKSPVFTVDLRHQADGSYNFGFVDTTHAKGPLTYVPVDSSQGFWGFTAAGFSINGKSVSTKSIEGIADTGTSLMALDNDVVEAYYAQVKTARLDQDVGGYVYDCSETLPSFGFGVGKATITVSGELMQYAVADESGEVCFGGLQSNDGLGISIFGDIALKAAVVVFDGSASPRLGWAQK